MTFSAPDWTVGRYRELLIAARHLYKFESFGTACDADHALWRHDIDYSLDCALEVAETEAELGVRATYFVLLSSPYYNVFEPASTQALCRIVAAGHWLGLHFDPEAHPAVGRGGPELERAIAREAVILADLGGAEVRTVSFHNPALVGVLDIDRPLLAGLVNAYGAPIRDSYIYASDSFGYWRHRPLDRVLTDHPPPRLHALTHPVWWQARQAGSRARIAAVAERRAHAILSEHDRLLARAGMYDTLVQQDELRGFAHPPDRRSVPHAQ